MRFFSSVWDSDPRFRYSLTNANGGGEFWGMVDDGMVEGRTLGGEELQFFLLPRLKKTKQLER